ncbi:MAG: bifunctional 2-polyprenyl-6-hydroxyphenol methylase/3-demethylubiquinol 3-O-methyltransferase UbiG [Nitratireductor sp.]
MADNQNTTIDQAEVERFSAMAAEWWNPTGKFRPLHKFNPVRLEYIKRQVCENFARDINDPNAFAGLRILDIGCGGGLLSEPMARLGGKVTGADASATNIEIASLHARQSGLDIDYRATTSEELERQGEKFDVILNMEVVEHVSDVGLFISSCSAMVKPGGLMFIATINRTMKAWALAIVAAENVLRWLPKGTHQYERLVRPDELETPLSASGMQVIDRSGVFYNVLQDRWNLSRDMDVNYMILARRPAAT